jgi:hypothetical protein
MSHETTQQERQASRPAPEKGNPFRDDPSIALVQLFERVSRRGMTYLYGRLGSAKVIVVRSDRESRGDHVWQLFLGDGPQQPDDAADLAREVREGAALDGVTALAKEVEAAEQRILARSSLAAFHTGACGR